MWRLIDAPVISDSSNKLADANGFFFQPNGRNSDVSPTETAAEGPNEKVQKMMDELSKLDEAVAKAGTEAEQSRLSTIGASS